MIEESAADMLPLWLTISAACGFMIGEVLGDNFRHRKYLEQANDDLRNELEKAPMIPMLGVPLKTTDECFLRGALGF